MTGKGRALLIATDGYSDDTFRQLRAPRADAEALAAVLADPAVGGYEVQTLHNPPAHEASLAIEDLFAAAWLDDLVLLYISGHGVRDDFGQLHLAMTNSRHDRLNATAVSAQFVRNQMDNTRSRRVVVVLDCCFAGAFPPGTAHRAGESVGVLSQLGGRGSAVMTSSSALEYSFESGGFASSTVVGAASPSVFTGALIEGLRSGGADRNGDGLIDVDELYDYIYEHVEAAGKPQTPGLDSQFQGRLIVAASLAAAGLPSEFAQAIRSSLPAVRLAIVDELSVLTRSADAGAVRAACTALAKLTEDDADSVAAAARAALAHAETVLTPRPAAAVKCGAVDEKPGLSRPLPVAPDSAVADTERAGASRQDAETRKSGSPGTGFAVFLGALIAMAALVATVALLPGLAGSGNDEVPPSFVAPPTRTTSLPDRVTCHYQPGAKNVVLRAVEPPASGEVPAKGFVLASINTGIGTLSVILDRSLAPCTVNDIVHLVGHGYYDDTSCNDSAHLYCGLWTAEVAGPGYTSPAEATEELRPGYLFVDPDTSPNLSLQLDDNQAVGTVIGTVSKESLRVLDEGRRNGSLKDLSVDSVTIQP